MCFWRSRIGINFGKKKRKRKSKKKPHNHRRHLFWGAASWNRPIAVPIPQPSFFGGSPRFKRPGRFEIRGTNFVYVNPYGCAMAIGISIQCIQEVDSGGVICIFAKLLRNILYTNPDRTIFGRPRRYPWTFLVLQRMYHHVSSDLVKRFQWKLRPMKFDSENPWKIWWDWKTTAFTSWFHSDMFFFSPLSLLFMYIYIYIFIHTIQYIPSIRRD